MGLLDEAQQCVEELKSPGFHPELVKETINVAVDHSPPETEAAAKLLCHLLNMNVLSPADIRGGLLLFAAGLDDVGIDLPKAPAGFGEIIGRLIFFGKLGFKVVEEALKQVEDLGYRAAVLSAAQLAAGEKAAAAMAEGIKACEALLG